MRLAGTATDTLRVRLSRSVDGDVALAVSDGDGRPLGSVAALSLRPAQAAGGTALGSGLQRLDWVRTPLVPAAATGRQWAVVGTDPRAAAVVDAVRRDGIGAALCYELASVAELATAPEVVLLPYLPDPRDVAEDLPYAVHEGLSELLDAVQQWVTVERGGSRLVVLADPDAVVSAPVWGLLRSAAAEHPGRFALADVGDGGPGTWRLLAAALDVDEPQCAVRDGAVLVPRVAAGHGAEGTAPDLTTGTVLVTGGTGGLGALVATHLVEAHGVRDLLLTSRRGRRPQGRPSWSQSWSAWGRRSGSPHATSPTAARWPPCWPPSRPTGRSSGCCTRPACSTTPPSSACPRSASTRCYGPRWTPAGCCMS